MFAREVVATAFVAPSTIAPEFFVVGPFSGPGVLTSLHVVLSTVASGAVDLGFSLGVSGNATKAAYLAGVPLLVRGVRAALDSDLLGMRIRVFGNIGMSFVLPLGVHIDGGPRFLVGYTVAQSTTAAVRLVASLVIEHAAGDLSTS